MAFSVASSSSSAISATNYSRSSELKALQIGSLRLLGRPAAVSLSQRRCSVKPVNAESKRNDSIVPLAAAIAESEVAEKIEVEDYEQLAKVLENSSPLEIMDKALEKFGNDIAIAFSGAEDVALIEYAKLTGRPFRVFSLDTGRLNPETYKFFDTVENHYGIHIEYMFPDAVEVQALVDPVFEGMDSGVGSLIKWNPMANVEGQNAWNFLRAMNVPVNSLHSQGYVSIGCEPCTRPVLPGQHEREGRWWWEDARAKECGLHKGNLKHDDLAQLNGNGNGATYSNGAAGVADIFNSQTLVNLSSSGITNLLRLENRKEPWIVVLYAPWCQFCQGMENSYLELADKLAGSGVKVGKFRADGDQKEFAKQELQLGSFPTILFFPKHSSRPIKYPSEKRDVESLMRFVNALR
ncbi:hypothetical protein GH714_000525 [Hevea brasiliensis]|uniref:Thioredoxin domain-containing protein n=1 Tax=Hevea brasiliensis TaxID=3981 RepID=A0A6A6LTY6_HEVBR|nr:hypothetical protein GH714_000525 [Hevea brasiliensis]